MKYLTVAWGLCFLMACILSAIWIGLAWGCGDIEYHKQAKFLPQVDNLESLDRRIRVIVYQVLELEGISKQLAYQDDAICRLRGKHDK